MKAKSLMTAALVFSLLIVSKPATADSVPVDLVINRTQHGVNVAIDIGNPPNGVPFENVDLSASTRTHGRGWGTLLEGQHTATSVNSNNVAIGPAFAGSSLTLTISIFGDNSGVMFARNSTRVGAAVGSFEGVVDDDPPAPICTLCTAAAVSTTDQAPSVAATAVSTTAAVAVAAATTNTVTAQADDVVVTEVPEPTSLILIGTGLFALAIWKFQTRRRGASS